MFAIDGINAVGGCLWMQNSRAVSLKLSLLSACECVSCDSSKGNTLFEGRYYNMEMGKLTAKLRDAVPVCLLVEGKEIKRYKNIEIPDELKMLEYQDFKLDVPLNGAITFKIMFDPGVLPEEFPQTRERRTRKPLIQEMQLREAASAVDVVAETESQLQDENATEAFPASEVEAFTQALKDARAAGEPVTEIVVAMVDGEANKVEIIEGDSEGRMLVITTEPDSTEAPAQPECDVSSKKPAGKGRGKIRAASTEDTGK